MEVPFKQDVVDQILADLNIKSIGQATIRQAVAVSKRLEEATGQSFIHFEIGAPGIPANHVGVEAQIAALRKGVANVYPDINGIPELKNAASRFVKAFLNVDVAPSGCVPSVGSMMGVLGSFLLCRYLYKERDTILFINPGFPVQPMQAKLLGFNRVDFDIYENRGEKLYEKIDELLSTGKIAAIIYSNPNNPSWVCLTEQELEYIGKLATKHDTIVLEDLAYLCMDVRTNKGKPFEAPYQPSVAHYTDNYILLLSGSKIFSYAGERIAVTAMSDKLAKRSYDYLQEEWGMKTAGDAMIYIITYALSSGVCHSAQYALAAMYDAACDGILNFVEDTRLYANRAEHVKEIFIRNGFHIVYDKDLDADISDGFFFTMGRKGFTGDELLAELLRYGISAITLKSAGSRQEGIRVCTSKISEKEYAVLDERLKIFDANNK